MLSAHPELYHTFLECGEECLAQLLDNAVDARDLPGMAGVGGFMRKFGIGKLSSRPQYILIKAGKFGFYLINLSGLSQQDRRPCYIMVI